MSDPPPKPSPEGKKEETHNERLRRLVAEEQAEIAGVRLPSGKGIVHVGQLPSESVGLERAGGGRSDGDFVPWSGWPIFWLAILHVVIVASFAVAYWQALKALKDLHDISGAIFVAATIAWFAFCGLLSTIVAKITLSLLAEARLCQSRRYVDAQVRTLLATGAERELIVRVIERSVYREGPNEQIDADAFAPVVQVMKLAKDMAETFAKKEK